VENILRPSVSRARHDTKHVLHAESDARPVMGLDLRHGNEEIRFEHCPREPEMFHARIVRSQRSPNQLVAIQIYKSDLLVSETLLITTLREDHLCVALMSRSLGYQH